MEPFYPQGVAHHGPKRSSGSGSNTFRVFRIILTNAVKSLPKVERYAHHRQSAIHIQGKKTKRWAEFLLTRALRRAGLR